MHTDYSEILRCLYLHVSHKLQLEIHEFTIIRSHVAEWANTIVKTMVNWNERTKQSNTTDKIWSLFFFCVRPF